MPINPLYEFVDENLAPAEAFLQYWRNRDQSQPQGQAMQPTTGSRGILEQPAYSLQANQPQMGAAPSVPSLPRRNPAQSAIRGVNSMSPMGGEQLPEMQFNDYQEPQRNIEGLGGLGQWDELPMGGAEMPEAPTPPPNILGADPGMYEEVEPRRLDEVNLPMTETKGRQQPLTTLMEPSGPIEEPQQPAVDPRLAQTTLGRQAATQGWDPRRMYAALAEFAGGVGNIRGKPTPSTSGKYYTQMYGEEQAQRENDQKMREMEVRFAPKPEKPIDAIAQLLKKAQFESISAKTQVDKELADPNSTRSVAARDALTRYMRWQGAEKFQADPNISAMEVFKSMTALQYGVGQQGLERRTIEANIGKEVEIDAKTDAAMKLQAQKDAAAMERQKAANAAALAKAKTTKDAKPDAQAQRTFKNSSELRKEYQSHPVTKRTFEVQSAWDKAKSVLDSPSPAGDMAAIFMFMRTLDPQSTVREGEYKSAAEATSALGRVETYANNVKAGRKLNDEQIKDFRTVMEKFYKAQIKEQARLDKQYSDLATRSGLSPQDLLIRTEQTEQAKPTVKSINDLLK